MIIFKCNHQMGEGCYKELAGVVATLLPPILLFQMFLSIIVRSMFSDLKLEVKRNCLDSCTDAENLELFRQRYMALCDIVEDLDRFMSPCLGMSFMIHPAATLFNAYGAFLIDLDESIHPVLWYGDMTIWILFNVLILVSVSIPVAKLNETVSVLCLS